MDQLMMSAAALLVGIAYAVYLKDRVLIAGLSTLLVGFLPALIKGGDFGLGDGLWMAFCLLPATVLIGIAIWRQSAT